MVDDRDFSSLLANCYRLKVSHLRQGKAGRVIIFGFGDRKVELLGSMGGVMDCPRCNNSSEWPIHRERSYFSLFFIPLIPYKTRFLLSCPVCRETREISAEEKDRYLGRSTP